jgi:hypothetical protein
MLLSALLLTAIPASSRGLEELEQRLARTRPVSTDFVEYRFSHLLKKPLRSSGTLEYRADGVMVRNVAAPARETTEVDGDQVRITRAGKATRTLSLQRAPQLRVLLGSFRALLEGQLTPLRQDFDVTLAEDATQWTLTLKPRDPTLAKHSRSIDVHGAVTSPRVSRRWNPTATARSPCSRPRQRRSPPRAPTRTHLPRPARKAPPPSEQPRLGAARGLVRPARARNLLGPVASAGFGGPASVHAVAAHRGTAAADPEHRRESRIAPAAAGHRRRPARHTRRHFEALRCGARGARGVHVRRKWRAGTTGHPGEAAGVPLPDIGFLRRRASGPGQADLGARRPRRRHGLTGRGLLEEWLPRDPTLELLHLAQRWQPRAEPHQVDGAWFAANASVHCCWCRPAPPPFDPDGQTQALRRSRTSLRRRAAARVRSSRSAAPATFSAVIRNRTQYEATWFGSFDTLGLITLLWLAYRRFVFTILGGLPLLTAGLAGLTEVSLVFDGVHGITIRLRLHVDRVRRTIPSTCSATCGATKPR